ncbi:MAG: hypothetical protein M1818_001209 [Claussenomyces sp. TS43310]|nr:MAG: hypothetical protein M1818_001209 [Claussenomyces sp. TS43310]
MKAVILRGLMSVGMLLHNLPRPHPPSPGFTVKIPSRLSSKHGYFKLVFYVPDDYYTADEHRRWPVVINFHGGGFTLGTGTDDSRWARAIVERAHAVMVSVEYRLAPRHPFSVGVEDGTDAVLYLAAHADELRLDPHRIALSGFSAGANFALTIPFLLHDLNMEVGRRNLGPPPLTRQSSYASSRSSSSESVPHELMVGGLSVKSTSTVNLPLKALTPTPLETQQELPDFTLRAIVSFYPPTDFRTSRQEKRATNPQPEKNLPPVLTNLFDESYFSLGQQQCEIDFSDPYLSPAAADDELIRAAYPESIILYTCEYDMLNAEGVDFGMRLASPHIGKMVRGGLIRGVPHAFDKKPNPISFPKDADRCYNEACAELNAAFGRRESIESKHQLDLEATVDRFQEETEDSDLGEGSSSSGGSLTKLESHHDGVTNL